MFCLSRAGSPGLSLVAILALAACEPAPTGPVAEDRGFIPGGHYVLVGMDGGTVALRDVSMVVEEHRVSGAGPCSSYSAENQVDLPLVSLGPINSPRTPCKDSRTENRFLSVLQQATEMEYYGGVLKVKSPSTWLIFERGMRADGVASVLDVARARD